MGSPTASAADVARFFGRMAFGATAANLDEWTGKPYQQLVDTLVKAADPAVRAAEVSEAQRVSLSINGEFNIADAQRWWMGRLVNTLSPVEERMTLFWHHHFATAYGPEPYVNQMVIQNNTIRVNALGNFRALVNAITVDSAMLHYLNGHQNYVRDLGGGRFDVHINENYGREFFELFTMGVMPQAYTEQDVREAARAFTGWRAVFKQPGKNSRPNASQFEPSLHDHGVKTILGRVVGGPGTVENVEYQRVTDIALDRPESAFFVAYKLVQNFGYDPVVAVNPATGQRDIAYTNDPLVTAVANNLQATDWDITSAVKTMVMHDAWRYATTLRVRMPAELVAHACKITNVGGGENNYPQMFTLTGRMGQALFQPPNVAGWPNGKAWLTQYAMIGRYDVGPVVWGKWQTKGLAPAPTDIAAWVKLAGLDNATLSETTRLTLQAYLAERASATDPVKRAGLFSLILSSPDWQVM